MLKLKRLMTTKYGQILVSAILGLGLATLFKRACRSGDCVVYKVPSREEIQTKVYKQDGDCYKVELKEDKCDENKKDLLLE